MPYNYKISSLRPFINWFISIRFSQKLPEEDIKAVQSIPVRNAFNKEIVQKL